MLTTLKEHPDAWTRVDAILEFSTNQQTKYYALQILEQVIKTRWKILPRNQCEGKYTFFMERSRQLFLIFIFSIFRLEWIKIYACIKLELIYIINYATIVLILIWSVTFFIGIKKYIVGLIIKTSSDPELMEREKVYLNKLNMILVQVKCSLLLFVFL